MSHHGRRDTRQNYSNFYSRDNYSNRDSRDYYYRDNYHSNKRMRSDDYDKDNCSYHYNDNINTNNDSSECALKFVLSSQLIGTIMGDGGTSLREFRQVTGTNIQVGSSTQNFPGTQLRVVYFTDTYEKVNIVQELLWTMIAETDDIKKKGGICLWSPASTNANLKEFDDYFVRCNISIPNKESGYLFGKDGHRIRAVSKNLNVSIYAELKEEAARVSEKFLNIAGTVKSCKEATSIILSMLMERNGLRYKYDRCGYPREIAESATAAGMEKRIEHFEAKAHQSETVIGKVISDPSDEIIQIGHNPRNPEIKVLTATATVEIALNQLSVGAIIGKQGVILHDIQSISGATIKIKSRDELLQYNRLVIITGTPNAVIKAHSLILKRVRQKLVENEQNKRYEYT